MCKNNTRRWNNLKLCLFKIVWLIYSMIQNNLKVYTICSLCDFGFSILNHITNKVICSQQVCTINNMLMLLHTKWVPIFTQKSTLYSKNTETTIFCLFCPWKLKKKTLKSRNFIKTAEIFSMYCLNGLICLKTEKVRDSTWSTWDV